MASPQLEGVIAMVAATRPGPATPLADQRAGYDGLGALLPRADGVTTEPDRLGGVAVERHHPPAADGHGAVVHLHGGGYTIGSLASHRSFATHLAVATGVDVVVPDYRLAPEHPFPAAREDALAVWRALRADLPAGALAVSGDSAGGGLALELALALRRDGDDLPAALALISPWTDLTLDGARAAPVGDDDPLLDVELLAVWAAGYAGEAALDDPEVSPLFADLTGLPPLLVHATDREVLHDDAVRLAERARAAGVDVTAEIRPGLLHHWHVLAGAVPEADEDLAELGAFLARHLR